MIAPVTRERYDNMKSYRIPFFLLLAVGLKGWTLGLERAPALNHMSQNILARILRLNATTIFLHVSGVIMGLSPRRDVFPTFFALQFCY